MRSYEEDFLGFSYGFRPKAQSARRLRRADGRYPASESETGYSMPITEAFSNAEVMTGLSRFLRHRIGDERILRLIRKWLKAGVFEEGIVHGKRGGYASGRDSVAPAGQCLLALRVRPLGAAVAETPRPRGHDRRPLC